MEAQILKLLLRQTELKLAQLSYDDGAPLDVSVQHDFYAADHVQLILAWYKRPRDKIF